ncbi:hypothetical protein SUGI_0844280 [Cryptomeria japonica]|nr:hypothetical protein SUGI_0844280 [Cryptomeria japonica]
MFSKIGTFDRLLDFPGLKLDLRSLSIAIVLLGYVIFHYRINRTVKGPRMWPLLGMLPSLLLHLNNTYDWVTKILIDCGGTFVFKGPLMSNLNCVVTAEPANLEYMLKLRYNNFPKGEYFRTLAHDFLGDGIFNADAEAWKRQRRTANIEFNTASFKAFMISSVQELVQGRLVPLLQNVARSRALFDLQELLLQFTFDNICMVTLGVDPGCLGDSRPEARTFAKAFEDVTEATMLRFLMPTALWRFMHFLHIGSERNLRASLMTVNRFIDDAIKTRNGSTDLLPGRTLNGSVDLSPGRADLLTAFMKVKTETGDPVFTDEMLRSISINFILAGREAFPLTSFWPGGTLRPWRSRGFSGCCSITLRSKSAFWQRPGPSCPRDPPFLSMQRT